MISAVGHNPTKRPWDGRRRAASRGRMRVEVGTPRRRYVADTKRHAIAVSREFPADADRMSYGERAYSPLAYAELLKGQVIDVTVYGF